MSVLKTLPLYIGIVFRGGLYSPEKKELITKSEFVISLCSSASLNIENAKDFISLRRRDFPPTFYGILFEVHSKTGRKVHDPKNALEEEVILLPGSKWKTKIISEKEKDITLKIEEI